MTTRRRALARQVLSFSPIRASARDDMPSVLNRVQDNLAQLLNTLAKAVAELQEAPTPSGGPPLSDAAPQALGAAAPGTSDDASRADHVHPLPDATDIPNFATQAAAAAPVQSVNGMTGAVIVPSGGLTYFAESDHTSAPNATVPANRLTPVSASANADFVVSPKGTGAILAQIPDDTPAGGVKRGANAVDFQFYRASGGAGAAYEKERVAAGIYSGIVCGQANRAGGSRSFVGGGRMNTADGTESAIAGGYRGNATGAYSFIGGGWQNTCAGESAAIVAGINNTLHALARDSFIGGGSANKIQAGYSLGQRAVIVGGTQNTINDRPGAFTNGREAFIGGGLRNSTDGMYSAIVGGSDNKAGSGAFVGGGFGNEAEGNNSTIPGGQFATARRIHAKYAYASGRFTTTGDAQYGKVVVRRQTTDATPTELTTDAAIPTAMAGYAINVNEMPNNAVYAIRVQVTAREAATGDVAAWEIAGVVKRGANAASTAVVGAPTVTLLAADTGAAAWSVNLIANTTRGGPTVQVTGEASKTIRWCATMHTTELAT